MKKIQCNRKNYGCKSCEPNPYFIVNDESTKIFEEFGINNNAFKEIHHMSNLLNIFMIFEVLLKLLEKLEMIIYMII